MDNLLAVATEARNFGKDRHRSYQVTLSRGLLDDWTLTILQGRTGPGGEDVRECHLLLP